MNNWGIPYFTHNLIAYIIIHCLQLTGHWLKIQSRPDVIHTCVVLDDFVFSFHLQLSATHHAKMIFQSRASLCSDCFLSFLCPHMPFIVSDFFVCTNQITIIIIIIVIIFEFTIDWSLDCSLFSFISIQVITNVNVWFCRLWRSTFKSNLLKDSIIKLNFISNTVECVIGSCYRQTDLWKWKRMHHWLSFIYQMLNQDGS